MPIQETGSLSLVDDNLGGEDLGLGVRRHGCAGFIRRCYWAGEDAAGAGAGFAADGGGLLGLWGLWGRSVSQNHDSVHHYRSSGSFRGVVQLVRAAQSLRSLC